MESYVFDLNWTRYANAFKRVGQLKNRYHCEPMYRKVSHPLMLHNTMDDDSMEKTYYNRLSIYRGRIWYDMENDTKGTNLNLDSHYGPHTSPWQTSYRGVFYDFITYRNCALY